MADAIAAEVLRAMPNGVAGLRLQFMDALAARIVNDAGEFPRVASEAERRLAMRTAMRAIPELEGRGVASMLERSYRDVRDSGLTLAEFAKPARGLRNPERTRAIVRAWTEYERLIAQLNAIDPADLLAMAARRAELARPQLLAGFYDMTGAQKAFADALIAAGKVTAVWTPVGDRPEAGATRGATPSEVVSAFDTRLDELRSVCASVAELLAQGITDVGIVARSLDPYDAQLIRRFASEHGFTTTLGDEMPLAAHRIGRGAIALLRLRERGFPRADVLELLRDGLYTRTRINVDRADAETRRARIAGGTSAELRVMRSRSPVVEDYIALVAELEELTASLGTDLGSLFRVETETDLLAAQKLDDIAALFRRASVWNRGLDALAMIDAIEQETLARASTGVWVSDVMRFRGRTFSHLFAVRMQDDVFPQRRTEDPLVPDSDRRILGVREIGDGRDEEALLFGLLRDGTTGQVHYSYASGDGFGKVLRASRYLRPVAGGQSPVASREVPRQPATGNRQRQLQLLVKSGTASPFDGYVPAIRDQVRAKLESVSPTQLEDFGECPQKFLFKHILGVEDLDHPERELQVNHRDKGILDHRVMERFYRDLTPATIASAAAALPRVPRELVERLETLVDEVFDDHEAEVPPFNRTVRAMERRATKRILREFVAADLADLAANELIPQYFEYRFGRPSLRRPGTPDAPPFELEVGDVMLRVEGTIDRIDAGNERFRIVDYKSGKALRHVSLGDKIDRGVRLQLALYAMAVARFFNVDAVEVSGTIKPLVTGDISKFAFALDQKRDGLLSTLGVFTNAILDCVFPAFVSRDGDFDSCKYCPVNHSCRTRHDFDERRAVQQHRDPRTLLMGARQ